jgi:hypothetical protein
LGQTFDKHIDDEALRALVPWPADTGAESLGVGAVTVRELVEHIGSCADCCEKVARYRQLVSHLCNRESPPSVLLSDGCPSGHGIDWYEVASGLWPEERVSQLILHAASCEHCGPLLRAAASLNFEATSEEERLLAELRRPALPERKRVWLSSLSWPFMKWALPAVALMVMVGIFATLRPDPSLRLSGPDWARLAARMYEQQVASNLPLAIRSDSPQAVNEWLKSNSNLPVALTLPESREAGTGPLPFRLQGARLVRMGGGNAALVAYQMASGVTTLLVSPASMAVAAGGVEAQFSKVSFHYAMVDGHKVVTWSQHGLTYALVSDEGISQQQSCMVCHSGMRDRDLTHTPTPLQAEANTSGPVWE